jgi:hypothetical protein
VDDFVKAGIALFYHSELPRSSDADGIWGSSRIGDAFPSRYDWKEMKEKHSIAHSRPADHVNPDVPVRELDVELTPKAEARAANKLPRAEQLNRFEKDLEAHDPGNQPS